MKIPPIFIAAVAFLLAAVTVPAMEFPAGGFAPGWQRSGPVETYVPTALYNVIDGGAELFLEMGFVDLRIQKYTGAGVEIVVEAYHMENAAAALGIYLIRYGHLEAPLLGIGERHSGDRFQVALLKNDYFILINSFSGREDLVPVMTVLAQRLAATIPAGGKVHEFDILPSENRLHEAPLLVRGPYSLQSIYTLGDGDILLLEGKRFAAVDLYADAHVGSYQLIVAPYEDEAMAIKAFENLRRHLDPYLQVLAEETDWFLFKDFQDLYGMAELRGRRIEVRIKMDNEPAPPGGAARSGWRNKARKIPLQEGSR